MFEVQCETCGAVIDQAGQWRCHKCAAKREPADIAPGTGPYHRSAAAPLAVVGPGMVATFNTASDAELAVQRLNLAWRYGRLVQETDAIGRAEASQREAAKMICEARKGISALVGIRASRRWRDYAMVGWGMATAAAFGWLNPERNWSALCLLAVAFCALCAIRGMWLAVAAERELSGVVKGKPE